VAEQLADLREQVAGLRGVIAIGADNPRSR
jgi:hypothetical protein